MLGLLLVRDEITSVDLLIQELWGDEPPRSALTTLQTYIYHARRMFDQEGFAVEGRNLLVTCPPGYQLLVDPSEVDVKVFERLVHQGRDLLDQGKPETATVRLKEALDLWHGPALANITAGDVLKGYVTHLDEMRIRALELRIEAEKKLGRTRELIPELRALVTAYPLNEWFHGQLIDALFLSGRRAEALRAYQDLRKILDEQLGIEPTPELQLLQLQVLGGAAVQLSRSA